MRTQTLHLLRSLGKLGAVGAGVAVSITATVVAVKAAGAPSRPDSCVATIPCCPPQQHLQIPEADHPPFRKWNFNWDRMEPGQGGNIWPAKTDDATNDKNANSSSEEYPKARRHILLIRHGQYDTSGEDDCSHTLTELGKEQAAITGKKLGSMGIKFTSITSSCMTRALQTTGIILKNMDAENQKELKLEVIDPLLAEGTPCKPEPPYRNPELWNPPQRVQRDILVEGSRIEAAFRKYFHRAEKSQQDDSWEIYVCHGNVIRYFSCRALQFPPEGWLRMSIDHCSITRMTILPTGEVVLRGLGDSGHIPYEKTTAVNYSIFKEDES